MAFKETSSEWKQYKSVRKYFNQSDLNLTVENMLGVAHELEFMAKTIQEIVDGKYERNEKFANMDYDPLVQELIPELCDYINEITEEYNGKLSRAYRNLDVGYLGAFPVPPRN